MTANLHHPIFSHSLTYRQTIDSHQARHQNRGKRMADKLKPFVSGRTFRHKARGDGFQANQHQRQQNQRQAEAERRHFAFAKVWLANIVRNVQFNIAADEVTPQRPGNNHPRDSGAQANQDHPAKVGMHLRGEQISPARPIA